LTSMLSFQGFSLIITRFYMPSSFEFPNLLHLDFGVSIIVVVCTLHPNLWAFNFGVLTNCGVSSLLCAHSGLGYKFWSFD